MKRSDPVDIAEYTIIEMLIEGAKKHDPDSWRVEPQDNHLDKAARHILTYKLQRDGNEKADGENHLRNALCRVAMALVQHLDGKGGE